MPELPEVETIRRDLEPLVTGRRVLRTEVERGARYGTLESAVGREILRIVRRGKYLLFDLGDRELVVHLGMSGQLFLCRGEPPARHLRAAFHLDGPAPACLAFADMRRFGTLQVVRPGDYRDLPTLAAMGPEPLSARFAAEPFVAAASRASTAIKALLLGQKVVAGLGNIYADEALHLAGIHPAARGLSRRQALALHRAIRRVLEEAIANRGTTFSLYRDGNGAEGRHYEALRVFDRTGEPCGSCGTAIAKIRVAGRGTHFCPTCQH